MVKKSRVNNKKIINSTTNENQISNDTISTPTSDQENVSLVFPSVPVTETDTSEVPAIAKLAQIKKKEATTKKKKTKPNKDTTTSTNETLKISEKRLLVHSLVRTIDKGELMFSKVMRYFVDTDLLKDPVKQSLVCGIQLSQKHKDTFFKIMFTLNNTSIPIPQNTFSNLKKLSKDIEVNYSSDQMNKSNNIDIVVKYKPTLNAKLKP